MMKCWHTLGGARFIGKTLLSILMICCLTDIACSDPSFLQRGSGDREEGSSAGQGRLDQIRPGTVIANKAPKGWSHLIIKSSNRAGAGDVKQLSPTAERLSRLLFTAIVADVRVQPEGNRYKLAKVAIGLGTRIGDKDIIITPDTQKKLGANLGLIARVVLRTAQEKLAAMSVAASTPTLMVFDSPTLMAAEGAHRPIVLRYAVIVEERSGSLNAFAWVLGRDADGKYGDPIGALQCLPENLIRECVLHVDGKEFSMGQPTEKAFAVLGPPKGRKEIELSGDLKSLAARQRFSATAAAELETKLREALKKDHK
jgi:hypothetical protein